MEQATTTAGPGSAKGQPPAADLFYSRDEKRTLAWGDEQAGKLFRNTLARFNVRWEGMVTLDFGCSWGYLAKYLAEHQRVKRSYGVDLFKLWEMLSDDWSPGRVPNLELYAGDILTIPQLQDVRFDRIVTFGTFMLISPTKLHDILLWMYDHLVPGGECIFRTRTFFSYCGGDLHNELRSPVPHLLYPRRIIDAYLAEKGRPASREMNPMCAASYLMLYRRCGFELLDAHRVKNPLDESVYAAHADKLSIFDPQELRTTEVMAHLRRPAAAPDLRELEGTA